AIKYNNYTYELSVLETKPGPAVTIIECDMNVEFAPPVGYTEPQKKAKEEEPMTVDPAELMPEPAGFVAFKGSGSRLDGKKKKEGSVSESAPVQRANYVRGIPDYDHPFGLLRFDRTVRKEESNDNKPEEDPFEAFKGTGFSLKKSRK
ncbi:ubiquitin fusion degradation protein 1 homolog, partial [Armigeres subalbatus]